MPALKIAAKIDRGNRGILPGKSSTWRADPEREHGGNRVAAWQKDVRRARGKARRGAQVKRTPGKLFAIP
jgi:hypothetical protein